MAHHGFDSIRRLALTGRLVLASCSFVAWSASAPLTAGTSATESRALTPAEAELRIAALRTEIAHHDELYFRQAAPDISDFEYDRLKRELADLRQAFPASVPADGATAGIGDDRSGRFPVYRHRVRMLSLSKSYSESELRAFDARLSRQLQHGDLEYVVEPKFDGIAISVTYENGRLVRAVTRGDGVEGDDITANVLTIPTLSPTLKVSAAGDAPALIELRGEIYLDYAEFARINRERENAGEEPFAHPRNLAAGTLKMMDPRDVAERHMAIVFYGCGACEPASVRPRAQTALLERLRAWGLPAVEKPRVVRGADAMWRAVQAIGRERVNYPFPTDGAVVKVNEVAAQQRLGATAQVPLWAMAYKFAPERVATKLRAITIQVGRTGVLTPVAELDPVQVGGTIVSRATLFNRDEIARRDLRIGDYVYVEKSGEIIPAIAGVDLMRRPPNTAPYIFPTTCPACGGLLMQAAGEAAVRCPDLNCPVQVRRRLEHFASENGVGIPGLGPVLVERLVAGGLVRTPADLYRLRRSDLLNLGGGMEASADRLLAAIDRSKRAGLERFICGLGIPQVGAVTSRHLARQFGSLAALARVQAEDLVVDHRPVVPGLGEKASLAVLAYFSRLEIRAMVTALLELGVNPTTTRATAGQDSADMGRRSSQVH